jgi:AcrR family transcriptional regulator
MNPNRREKKRIATLDEIRATAWQQIAEAGAAALSLRGIAREMGMTAPALYRYYKDRDSLITALLIDAFTAFTGALENGRDAYAAADHAGRFRAICKSYFDWAMQNPQRYALMFGTPIPDQLFASELGPVAQRSFLVLQGVIGEAHSAGILRGEITALRLPARLRSRYEALKTMGMPYVPLVTHLALLYQYLSGFLAEQVESFVDIEIERMARIFGFV